MGRYSVLDTRCGGAILCGVGTHTTHKDKMLTTVDRTTDRQGRTYEMVGDYRYRITSTKRGSSALGNCEVCGKPCDVVHLQIQQHYAKPQHPWIPEAAGLLDASGGFWTHNGCTDRYGHPDCLRSARP